MMVSNALSARRGPLRRPKVCHTATNPGRCEPPPPPPPGISCAIIPSTATITNGDSATFELEHCNASLPVLDPIDVELIAEEDAFDLQEGSVNCQPGQGEYQSFEAGVFPISMRVTFSDLTVCGADAVVTVEEI